jgi:membrane fusion protein (multidrug efflux system)
MKSFGWSSLLPVPAGVAGDNRRLRPMALLLALVGAGAGCTGEKPAAQQGPAGPPPAVVVAEVIRRDVPVYGEYVAQTVANSTVDIPARVEATLEKVLFDEGRSVKKGQILFELDPRTYKAAVQAARAALSKAEADLVYAKQQFETQRAKAQLAQNEAQLVKAKQDVDRLRPLIKEDAVPQQDFDNAIAAQNVAQAQVDAARAQLSNTQLTERTQIDVAQAAVESARAALIQAQLNLSYCTIRSPIDGISGRKKYSIGNLVGRGDATVLVTVSSSDPIWVDFNVSELDSLRFRKRTLALGQRPERVAAELEFELLLADNTRFPYKGRFKLVERGVDPRTGTITVRAEFPNPDLLLRPGQFGRVRAVLEEKPNAVLVPQRAVTELQSVKSVLVVGSDNKVSLKSITLGDRYEQYFVVNDGLNGGERVIVEGQLKVRPGMTVTPTLQPVPATWAPGPAGGSSPPAAGTAAPAPPTQGQGR